MSANRPAIAPAALHTIRVALVSGVLLFGAVVWYVNRGVPTPRVEPSAATPFRFAFYALLLGSVAGVYVVRTMRSRAVGYDSRANLTIIAWAVAEGAALFGGVIYLLTDDPLPYLAGVILFVGALAVLGIPRQDGGDAGD